MKLRKWTIWRANLDPVVGSEQGLTRPVLITEESIVLCHQIRTLDKKRFAKFYGEITDSKKQTEIIEALFFQLGIDNNYIPAGLSG